MLSMRRESDAWKNAAGRQCIGGSTETTRGVLTCDAVASEGETRGEGSAPELQVLVRSQSAESVVGVRNPEKERACLPHAKLSLTEIYFGMYVCSQRRSTIARRNSDCPLTSASEKVS